MIKKSTKALIAVLLFLTVCSVVRVLNFLLTTTNISPVKQNHLVQDAAADTNATVGTTKESSDSPDLLIEPGAAAAVDPPRTAQMKMGTTHFTDRNNNTLISNGMVEEQNVEIFNVSNRDDNATETPLTIPSYLQFEVVRIMHTPREAKITVTFKDSNDRKCLKPRIMGRLSGQYLTIIQWNDANTKMTQEADANVTREDAITGYYKVPSPGRYFIEILGLLCNDFPFDAHFRNICLEDTAHNHLTAQNSFIDVTVTTANAAKLNFPAKNAINKNPLGHWKWSDESTVPVPMKTRYQGQNCRGSTEPRCMNSTDLDRFDHYRFEWSNGVMNDPTKFQQRDTNDQLNLCVVGFSHSRKLMEQFRAILPRGIKTTWHKIHFPAELTMELGKEVLKSNCTFAIVGVGQWAGSKGVTFPDYYKQLDSGVQILESLGINVVLRKIHYNPLGDAISHCPPGDNRSPVVIDGYNEILRNLARKHNVSFIDTGDMMDSMWDAAPDYCHYTKLEARMEAFYIVQEFLRMADEKENNNTTTTTAGDFDRITTDNTTSIFK